MDQLNSAVFASNYLEDLLKGNRKQCSTLVKDFLSQNPSITDVYENVLKVALYNVGLLWEKNKISVATEHMATAITEGILNELFEQIIPEKKYQKKVIVACVENENHQVGIKMVADVFEMQGWGSYFLGAGIPTTELLKYIKEINPDIIAISLSVYFNYGNLVSMINILKKEFPNLSIIVGGQALIHVKDQFKTMFPDVIYISDLYLLETFIKSINSKI